MLSGSHARSYTNAFIHANRMSCGHKNCNDCIQTLPYFMTQLIYLSPVLHSTHPTPTHIHTLTHINKLAWYLPQYLFNFEVYCYMSSNCFAFSLKIKKKNNSSLNSSNLGYSSEIISKHAKGKTNADLNVTSCVLTKLKQLTQCWLLLSFLFGCNSQMPPVSRFQQQKRRRKKLFEE